MTLVERLRACATHTPDTDSGRADSTAIIEAADAIEKAEWREQHDMEVVTELRVRVEAAEARARIAEHDFFELRGQNARTAHRE